MRRLTTTPPTATLARRRQAVSIAGRSYAHRCTDGFYEHITDAHVADAEDLLAGEHRLGERLRWVLHRPLIERLVRLSRLRVARPATKDLVALINDLTPGTPPHGQAGT